MCVCVIQHSETWHSINAEDPDTRLLGNSASRYRIDMVLEAYFVQYTCFDLSPVGSIMQCSSRAQRPLKHKDPTYHGFLVSPLHGASGPECGILMFMWSLGPLSTESFQKASRRQF